MLDRSDQSFAMIFSRWKGVRFIPAQEIRSIDRYQVYEVGSRSLYGFFLSHVECQIGDGALDSPTIDTLEQLALLPHVPRDVRQVLAMKVIRDSRTEKETH
jgi:hypothetical protein